MHILLLGEEDQSNPFFFCDVEGFVMVIEIAVNGFIIFKCNNHHCS